MTNDAHWLAARRRRPGAARAAAAIALHLLAWLALTAAFDRVDLRVGAERSTTLVKIALAPPPPARMPAPAPAPAKAKPAPRRAHEPPIAVDKPSTAITLPAPEPVAAAAPAPGPASAPRPMLDPEATRRAILAVARDPSLSGMARDADPAPGANERLAQGLAAGAKGDCMKSEYLGAGAGLISIPFLLAAEAMGKCSHK